MANHGKSLFKRLVEAGFTREELDRIRSLTEPALQWGDAGWAAELGRYRELIERRYALPPA